MYRHYDGYPSGHGVELARYLTDCLLVNGWPSDDAMRRYAKEGVAVFNGADSLAAHVVKEFASRLPEEIYLMPTGVSAAEVCAEYVYDVIPGGKDCGPQAVALRVCQLEPSRILYEGPAASFDAALAEAG